MATEITGEAVTAVQTEEIDFGFDAGHIDGHAGDDFDFDLGGDDGKVEDRGAPIEDHDEIGYEEETHAPVAQHYTTHHASEEQASEKKTEIDNTGDGDEIDYEDDDLATTANNGDHAAGDQVPVTTAQPEATEQHDDIDFGFDTTEGEAHLSEQDDGATEQAHEVIEDEDEVEQVGADEAKEDDEQDEEDEEDEENNEESDESLHDYGGDDDDDSHDGVSQDGFTGIDSLEPVYTTDVTVTWGDEVCPLFRSSDGDDPDSFYLEDEEALDFPLSKFLQTIRGSIDSYLNKADEIFIRIDELGLEFGETTTEALLSQVTFHNLLALHSTLLKNDDPTVSNSVHVTLGTRPNCLLRLKDLVGGASLGKGLSAFQKTAHTSPDDSPNESDDKSSSPNEAENDELEEEDEEDEEAVEGDEGGAPVSDADLQLLETTGAGDTIDLGLQEEVDVTAHGAEDDIDFIEYHDEEMAGGATLDGAEHPDVTSGQAEQALQANELGLAGEADQHRLDISADSANANQDELDLLVDLEPAEGAAGQETDDHGMVHLEPDNGLEFIDHEHEHGEHAGLGDAGENDDFLNLHDDDMDESLAVGAPNAQKAPVADEVEASLGTSATATLDNDEIDYEDIDTSATGLGASELAQDQNGASALEAVPATTAVEAPTDAAPDAGLDEIDWDDEIKNHAPSEPLSTPATATGKRVREGELDDGLLGDLPDIKRHRTGETPS